MATPPIFGNGQMDMQSLMKLLQQAKLSTTAPGQGATQPTPMQMQQTQAHTGNVTPNQPGGPPRFGPGAQQTPMPNGMGAPGGGGGANPSGGGVPMPVQQGPRSPSNLPAPGGFSTGFEFSNPKAAKSAAIQGTMMNLQKTLEQYTNKKNERITNEAQNYVAQVNAAIASGDKDMVNALLSDPKVLKTIQKGMDYHFEKMQNMQEAPEPAPPEAIGVQKGIESSPQVQKAGQGGGQPGQGGPPQMGQPGQQQQQQNPMQKLQAMIQQMKQNQIPRQNAPGSLPMPNTPGGVMIPKTGIPQQNQNIVDNERNRQLQDPNQRQAAATGSMLSSDQNKQAEMIAKGLDISPADVKKMDMSTQALVTRTMGQVYVEQMKAQAQIDAIDRRNQGNMSVAKINSQGRQNSAAINAAGRTAAAKITQSGLTKRADGKYEFDANKANLNNYTKLQGQYVSAAQKATAAGDKGLAAQLQSQADAYQKKADDLNQNMSDENLMKSFMGAMDDDSEEDDDE
jgi:hypothetical protein